MKLTRLLFIFFLLSFPALGQESKLKDLVEVKGVRSNSLIGYGLVVGLQGTGDSAASLSTNRSIANMMTRLGIKTSSNEVVSGNIAAVIVNGDLPAFMRGGEKIDLRISAVGDAKSLAGGTLLMAPLKAGDGNVYVIAQGAVVVGQALGSGSSVLTVATVPQGGTVEKEFIPVLAKDGYLDLSLKTPDFTTNSRVSDVINTRFKGFFAQSLDPVTIRVEIPELYIDKLVEFVSEIENLKVVKDKKAMVVINERTGTVVMGNEVTISSVTISHGSLSIKVEGSKDKSTQSIVDVPQSTVGSLIESLNALGVKPKDLIGIIQAMHTAGAIQAELKFM